MLIRSYKPCVFRPGTHDYGRYLLISSSRPGGEVANFQSVWNLVVQPAWGCEYTININAEMNYWLAEVCALGECVEPLFVMLEELAVSGTRTARVLYGAEGWMAHHNVYGWRIAINQLDTTESLIKLVHQGERFVGDVRDDGFEVLPKLLNLVQIRRIRGKGEQVAADRLE